MGRVLTATGGVLVALGALSMFVLGPLLTTPPPSAEGANIGAGIFALFNLLLLVAGLVIAAVGAATWVVASRQRTSSGRDRR